MGRKKLVEDDEVERLQKEVRELKSLNRSLMKRLKKIDREYAEEIEKANSERAQSEDVPSVQTRRSLCGHCGKGNIVTVDIVGRKFQKCDTCDWKSGRKIP